MVSKFVYTGTAAMAALLSYDLVPQVGDFLDRIHIGRYQDRQRWSDDVAKTLNRWLVRTPKVKATDHSRLILIDLIRGDYHHAAIQHWQQAALVLGSKAHRKDPAKDGLVGGGKDNGVALLRETLFDSKGQWTKKPDHVDSAILAYAFMKDESSDVLEKYRPAWDHIWNLIQEHVGADGTVAYRKPLDDYRYVDTVGFICPFLVKYGMAFDRPECVRLAMRQIEHYGAHGMGEAAAIPYHAYRVTGGIPLGVLGWGRGVGWYAIGLMDAYAEMPSGHKDRGPLKERITALAEEVMRFQTGTGAWTWMVTRPESRPDSSATAVLSWFLCQASELSDKGDQLRSCGEKGLRYLMTVTRRDGVIDFSQGDTRDIGVYAQSFSPMPFTQGFALRAARL